MKHAAEQAFAAWLDSRDGEAAMASGLPKLEESQYPGHLNADEQQMVEWLLALLREQDQTTAAQIALYGVRLAGTETIARRAQDRENR